MTSQLRQPSSPLLVSRFGVRGIAAGLLVSMLSLAMVMGGCAAEEEPVAVAPPPAKPVAPPPPPPPKAKSVADLMAEHRFDERLVLPEDQAPATTEERVAVLEFFDAFARGDNKTLSEMMTLADSVELDALVESGVWQETVEKIERIEIATGPSVNGPCALGVFTVDLDYQPQLWYYNEKSGEFTFEAAPSPPDMINKLSGADWIQKWHEILEDEIALADEPEEDLNVPQINLDDEDSGSTSSGGSAPSPGGPGALPSPGSPGPRRRPAPRNPRRPPGPQPGR